MNEGEELSFLKHKFVEEIGDKIPKKYRLVAEATFKCGQKSQIVRCRTCFKRRIVRQSAAKIVKLCGEIAANINQKCGDCAAFSANFWLKLATALYQ